MRFTVLYAILAVVGMSAVAHADDVNLYAAGSLRTALTDIGAAFAAKTGHRVVAKFGPSGVLEKEIARGAKDGVIGQPACG
jgi:molybdate transport system substrate-binding protein